MKNKEIQYIVETKIPQITSQMDNIVQDTNDKFSGVENKKLDKNGIVTMANIGQDVKEAMTGGSVAIVGNNAILEPNLVDGQVTDVKTSFIEVVSNNKLDSRFIFSDGYIDRLNGSVVLDNSGIWRRTDYIPVVQGQVYTITPFRHYALYNNKKEYISGANETTTISKTITIPQGVYYIRYSWGVSNETTLGKPRLNIGGTDLKYDDFTTKIKKDRLYEIDDITLNQCDFSKSYNLYDDTKRVVGLIDRLTGVVDTTQTVFVTSDFCNVKPTKQYLLSKVRFLVYFDKYKQCLGYADSKTLNVNYTFTTPQNCYYVRFSLALTDNPSEQMLSSGTSPNPKFYPFGTVKISEDLIEKVTIPFKAILTLPSKIYTKVGKQVDIYTSNITDGNMNTHDFFVADGRKGTLLNDRYTITTSDETIVNAKFELYRDYEEQCELTTSIIPKNITINKGVKKIMVLGDSFIDMGYITERLLKNSDSDNMLDIELIGTRVPKAFTGYDIRNKHEGRGGWAYDTYVTSQIDNPFYNPTSKTFDFSYYMTNNNFTQCDVLVINLGVNDVFSPLDDKTLDEEFIPTAFNAMSKIIASAKTFNPNIKICLNMPTPPNSTDTFGWTYGTYKTNWRVRRNIIKFNSKLISTYDNRHNENIYVVPTALGIDCKTEIKDGVHPTETGFNKLADTIYNYICCIL